MLKCCQSLLIGKHIGTMKGAVNERRKVSHMVACCKVHAGVKHKAKLPLSGKPKSLCCSFKKMMELIRWERL